MSVINSETQEKLYRQINAEFSKLGTKMSDEEYAHRSDFWQLNIKFIEYADNMRILLQKTETNEGIIQ